jgi:hypothetical protein
MPMPQVAMCRLQERLKDNSVLRRLDLLSVVEKGQRVRVHDGHGSIASMHIAA